MCHILLHDNRKLRRHRSALASCNAVMTGPVDSIAILRMHMLQADRLSKLCWFSFVSNASVVARDMFL